MSDVSERLRQLELEFVELRTEFNSLRGMLKISIALILAHFGMDISAVM